MRIICWNYILGVLVWILYMVKRNFVIYVVCIYLKFFFRYEYFNKGVDLYIEVLVRFNYLLKVFFVLMLLYDIDNNNNVDDDIFMFLEEIKIVLIVFF